MNPALPPPPLSDARRLLPPVLVGIVVRLLNLRPQIPGGDELHPLRAALELPLGEILTTYRPGDHCIPLTALYRGLLELGVPLSEPLLRLPLLLCGIAALGLLPWLVDRWWGPAVAVRFAWLLALAPMLVLYSRILRSYMPVVLLTFVACAAFLEWWSGKGGRWGVVYVLCGALALWFHLGSGPLVVAPFLFAVGEGILRRRFRDLPRLLLPGLGLTAACAAFLLPARHSLARLLEAKAGSGQWPDGAALLEVARLLAGMRWAWVTVLFYALVVWGAWYLWRRDRRLALYAATLCGGHLAGLAVLAPFRFEVAPFFSRYVLVLLPWLLLAVAVGLTDPRAFQPEGRLRCRARTASANSLRSDTLRPTAPDTEASEPQTTSRTGATHLSEHRWSAATAAFLLLFFLAGPVPTVDYRATAFAHHSRFLALDPPSIPSEAVPPCYRLPEDGPLLEIPWHSSWGLSQAVYAYQKHHRRRVLVSILEPALFRPPTAGAAGSPAGKLSERAGQQTVQTTPGEARSERRREPQAPQSASARPVSRPENPAADGQWTTGFHFRNLVAPEPAAFLASPARYLVVHRDVVAEENALHPRPLSLQPRRQAHRQRLADRGEALARRLRREWGPPLCDSPLLAVWDLDAPRAAGYDGGS